MRRRLPWALALLLVPLAIAPGCKPTGQAAPLGLAVKPAGSASGVTPPRTDDKRPPATDLPDTPSDLPIDPVGPTPQLPPLPTDLPDPGGNGIIGNNGGSLIGRVRAPLVMLGENGASIISNNGANIIGNNGGNIIGNNGAGLIGRVRYDVLAASGPDGGLANALLYLTNRDEKFYFRSDRNAVFTASSDADGAFAFDTRAGSGFPFNRDVIVNAVANQTLRFTGYMIPAEGADSEVKLNLASTLGTELLRLNAYQDGRSLGSYDHSKFVQAVEQTEGAIVTGDISAVEPTLDEEGNEILVGTFDLRMDHVFNLRNQYVIALSAVDSANTVIKRISDLWKEILGYRPVAVTSVLGSGGFPDVYSTSYPPYVTGDAREGYPETAAEDVPLGFGYGVATSARGDVFVAAYTKAGSSGHIRWITPEGRITSVWLPTYDLVAPVGIAVEREPSESHPGTLLVVDQYQNMVFRIAIVEAPGETETSIQDVIHPMEIVAGEAAPFYDPGDADLGFLEADHPHAVDGTDGYPEVSSALPETSRWRLTDEGPRTYQSDPMRALAPSSARYGHLARPIAVCVDELGNIYVADKGNQRIRMIPKAADSYFGYRTPQVDGDGFVTGFGAATPMVPGALYTIAGNPAWDPARTPDDGSGRWFGAFGGDNGPAQEAQLDEVTALAFRDGYLYVADHDNQRIRRISRATGVIETVVGTPPGPQTANGTDYSFPAGTRGDGGPAKQAELASPQGIAFDASGRLYIADRLSGRIRMVDPQLNISTVAGRLHDPNATSTGVDNFLDGDALRWADLYDTHYLAVDGDGNILFTDLRHRRLRKVWRQWE